MNSLVKFWNEYDLRKPPYIHPRDVAVVRQYPKLFDTRVYDATSFINSERFGAFKDSRFHLSLLPVPYNGRLDTARIVILLLNPGFGAGDYFVYHDDEHTTRVKRLIRQNFTAIPLFIS
jgi:hypothetical protein